MSFPSTTPAAPAGGDIQPLGAAANDTAKNTLWMGELEPWMDENFIKGVFRTCSDQTVNVKVIRDKNSGSAGYCFVEFPTNEAATSALNLNGSPIPNSSRAFKLNWASGGGLVDRRDDRGPEYSIFVGDLGPEVNEYVLVALFQARFPSCKSAKIMTDAVSGQSRGYGFVRFSDETDQQRALVEMQGVYCGSRPMRISTATPKNRSHGYPGQHAPPSMMNNVPQQQMWPAPFAPPYAGGGGGGGGFNPSSQMNQFTDPNNTTVFVGGLSGYVTEDELRSFFQGFGEITYVKIPPGKGCGFVQFVHRHAAEMAINQMQGYPIGNSRVRLSWGRSQNNSGVGTPYRPAPPPPHYMGMGPSHPPYGGPQFGGPAMSPQGPQGPQGPPQGPPLQGPPVPQGPPQGVALGPLFGGNSTILTNEKAGTMVAEGSSRFPGASLLTASNAVVVMVLGVSALVLVGFGFWVGVGYKFKKKRENHRYQVSVNQFNDMMVMRIGCRCRFDNSHEIMEMVYFMGEDELMAWVIEDPGNAAEGQEESAPEPMVVVGQPAEHATAEQHGDGEGGAGVESGDQAQVQADGQNGE